MHFIVSSWGSHSVTDTVCETHAPHTHTAFIYFFADDECAQTDEHIADFQQENNWLLVFLNEAAQLKTTQIMTEANKKLLLLLLLVGYGRYVICLPTDCMCVFFVFHRKGSFVKTFKRISRKSIFILVNRNNGENKKPVGWINSPQKKIISEVM